MNNYLKSLLEYFVDETPLDTLQMRTLVDNGLVKFWEEVQHEHYVLCYELTEKGKQMLKGNV